MSEPIKPDDVELTKRSMIPGVVFEVINELIVENWRATSATATVKMNQIVERLTQRAPDVARQAFARNWLDVEHSYAEAGWLVRYDGPGYNESYEAYFVFSKKRKR